MAEPVPNCPIRRFKQVIAMVPPIAQVFVVHSDDAVLAAQSGFLGASGLAVEVCQSVEAFLRRRPSTGPACVVLDYHLPGLSTSELNRVLGDRALSVVFVTDHADVAAVVTAMKGGAVDFLAKPVDARQLLASVLRGLERSLRFEEERRWRVDLLERVGRLTVREREVAARLRRGLLNRQIASELGTTEKTVKVHRSRVMAKLEVGSIAELVRLLEDTGRPPALPSMPNGWTRGRRFEKRHVHSPSSQPKWRLTC
jgi:FixJ family two-component response regulator